jgi:hypothetical protein
MGGVNLPPVLLKPEADLNRSSRGERLAINSDCRVKMPLPYSVNCAFDEQGIYSANDGNLFSLAFRRHGDPKTDDALKLGSGHFN